MGSVPEMDKVYPVAVPQGESIHVPETEITVPAEVRETSCRILEIIFDYALNKFDDTEKRHAAGRPKFLSVIDSFVVKGARVDMCLPAFPFKSANKVHKVFGILPDKAEELALQRLNSMCARIADIYAPGAQVTIISDGLVYNDLLSIPDRDTWAYGEALRAMATAKGFTNISFSRLKDLLLGGGDSGFSLPEVDLREVSYVANATNFRRHLLNRHGKEGLDIEHEIATNPDTLMTYRGYCRFLESDLQYIFPTGKDRSTKAYKRDVKYLAKEMLIRGYAFAGAVKEAFPHHLRLSIHQSTGERKISMSLLNTKTGFTTPWHCSVALMSDGEWLSAPMGEFKKDAANNGKNLEVVYEDGRPSYFREVTGSTGVSSEKRSAGGISHAGSEHDARGQAVRDSTGTYSRTHDAGAGSIVGTDTGLKSREGIFWILKYFW